MSANVASDLESCSFCISTQEAELDYFESMQDRIYSNIQNLEIKVEEHQCLDEFVCKQCGDAHLDILKQHVILQDNIEYQSTLTFLCEIHRNNIYGIIQEEEEDTTPFVNTGCVNACPIHCDEWN
jgi:hypothetical protein